jgi:hypothetical protein
MAKLTNFDTARQRFVSRESQPVPLGAAVLSARRSGPHSPFLASKHVQRSPMETLSARDGTPAHADLSIATFCTEHRDTLGQKLQCIHQ